MWLEMLPPRADRPGMSHLIIDTDQKRQQQLRAVLVSLGTRSTAIQIAQDVSTGRSALARRQFECCFVFVKPTLPELLEAVTGLRPSVCILNSPLVVYTQGATRDFVGDVIRSGASYLLAYPFTARNVELALRVCSAPTVRS